MLIKENYKVLGDDWCKFHVVTKDTFIQFSTS